MPIFSLTETCDDEDWRYFVSDLLDENLSTATLLTAAINDENILEIELTGDASLDKTTEVSYTLSVLGKLPNNLCDSSHYTI